MSELKLRAMAKSIWGAGCNRRERGAYHEVKMIMQSIYLYDRIFFENNEETGTNLSYLPANEKIIFAYKAAKLLDR